MSKVKRGWGIGVLALVLALGAAYYLVDRSPAEPPVSPDKSSSAPSQPRDSAPNAAHLYDAHAKHAFLQALPEADRGRVVKLKSRWLLPQQDFEQAEGREQVYLHVRRWLTPAEKAELEGKGVRFDGPIPEKSYRVLLEPGAWRRIAAHPQVAGAAKVRAEDKLHQPIQRLARRGAAASRSIRAAVHLVPGAEAEPGAFVGRHIAANTLRQNARGTVYALLSAAEAAALAERPEVAYIGYVGYVPRAINDEIVRRGARKSSKPGTENEDAQDIHNVDDLRAPGFDLFGAGVRICEIDGGQVRASHEALTGRVTNVETDVGVDNHATHVCGTMIADPPTANGAEGMAPQASAFSYNFFDSVALGFPEDKAAHAKTTHAVHASNNSWGYVGGADGSDVFDETIFGDYDDIAQAWDQVVRANSLLVFKASGNDRNDEAPPDIGVPYDGHDGTEFPNPGLVNPFYDCISNWGVSKNIVCVGAIQDDGETIADFSSIGPADDGRIKPDVVANGDALLSTGSASNSAYVVQSGTSMATPTATGIAALLIEDLLAKTGSADPTFVKGLMIHTARDTGDAGPDYVHGFGSLDALAAVNFIRNDPDPSGASFSGSLDNADELTFTFDIPSGITRAKVTLLWSDPEGTLGAGKDLTNDLDLELVQPDSTVRRPFVMPYQIDPSGNSPAESATEGVNNTDNVEQAVIDSPAAGTWTLRVRGSSIPSGPQAFFLFAGVSTDTLAAPTITAPASNVTTLTPAISWTAVAGADLYEVRVDDVTGGVADFLTKNDLTATTHTFSTALTVGSQYRTRARARTGAGAVGPWSAFQVFTVDKLAAPVVTAPLGTISTVQPTVTWTSVSGAGSYDLNVRVKGGSSVYQTAGIGGTALTLPVALATGVTYQSIVTARNASGNASDPSAPGEFTVSFVNSGGGGGTVPDDNLNQPIQDFSGGGGGNNSGRARNQFSGRSPSPQPAPRRNSGGGSSGSADSGAAGEVLPTLAMPIPIGPLGAIGSTVPLIEWLESEGADHYELLVVDVTEVPTQVLLEREVKEARYEVKEGVLEPGRKYRFLVRALASGGAYSQVAPMDFEIAGNAKGQR